MQTELREVPLSQIDVGRRYRQKYEKEPLTDLIKSVKKVGVIQPISLINKNSLDDTDIEGQLDPDKPFLLAAGGRRYYASQANELDSIPAIVFSGPTDAKRYRELELWENLYREDLNHEEEVRLKKRIHDLRVEQKGEKQYPGDPDGHSMRDTAKELGESPATTSRDIQLADALDKHPELKGASSKKEAMRRFKRLQEKAEVDKRVKELQEKEENTPTDRKKKELIEAYKPKSFFEYVKGVDDESMSFVEIDPPYAVELEKLVAADDDLRDTISLTAEEYNDVDPEDYEEFMLKVFEETYRVMKPHSWGICWFAMDPWYPLVLEWLNRFDFFVKAVPALWIKPQGRNRNTQFLLSNGYEGFFYFRKGTPAIRKKGRLNYFQFPLPDRSLRKHPCEKPVELYEEILEVFTIPGNPVLVPFAGSGNMLLAANNQSRPAIGCDPVKEYRNDFVEKVHNQEPGNYKSYVTS